MLCALPPLPHRCTLFCCPVSSAACSVLRERWLSKKSYEKPFRWLCLHNHIITVIMFTCLWTICKKPAVSYPAEWKPLHHASLDYSGTDLRCSTDTFYGKNKTAWISFTLVTCCSCNKRTLAKRLHGNCNRSAGCSTITPSAKHLSPKLRIFSLALQKPQQHLPCVTNTWVALWSFDDRKGCGNTHDSQPLKTF